MKRIFLDVLLNGEWKKSVSGFMGFQLAQKLKYLKQKLKGWRKKVFANLQERKEQTLAEIQAIV